MVLLSTMDVNTPYYLLVAYSTILGVGSGMAYPLFNITAQNAFTLRDIGIVTASMRFFRNIGTIVFVPVFGYIMNLTMVSSAATLSKTQALVTSIQNIFFLAIILALVGLIVAFFLKEIPLGENSPVSQEEVPDGLVEKAE